MLKIFEQSCPKQLSIEAVTFKIFMAILENFLPKNFEYFECSMFGFIFKLI